MSSVTWELERCPKCLSTTSAALSDGWRLCLSPECRHEWDPETTSGPLGEIVGWSETEAGTFAIVVGGEEDDIVAQLAAARERYVGADVMVHELEAVGRVTMIDDGGIALVTFGSGFTVELEPDEFSAIEAATVPDEAVAAIAGTSATLAAQVIRAGAASMIVDEPEWSLGVTPENWLPMDADAIPVIEHGASYAIAMLALTYKISPEQLYDLAQGVDDAANAAKEATGQ